MAEPSASAAAQPNGLLAGLKARLKARPDTEHEQGVLRLVIGALLFNEWLALRQRRGATAAAQPA